MPDLSSTTLIRVPSSEADPLNVLVCLAPATLYTRMLRSWHAVKMCFPDLEQQRTV